MKRAILILVTAAMLSPVFSTPKITEAAAWVTVSSWAYNSVSNFKKNGLLPESFEDIDDYTQNITRVQFAELLRSTLVKAGCIEEQKSYDVYASYEFTDTENTAAAQLAGYNIMSGESVRTEKVSTGTGSTVKIYHAFYPDRLLTREEMAAVIYRAANRWCEHMITAAKDNPYTAPADDYDISLWAKESVYSLEKANIIVGMGDGSFAPKANLTIEQAIQVIYSLYNEIPATHEADGANIREDGEQPVKTFENGLSETKEGNVLYLKNGDTTLMEFETDIYSHVYSATVNGAVYAAAQNVYDKTDFYNAETGGLIFKIPRPVYNLTNEYIITKSANVGAVTFGVCDYSGNEILPPEYSLAEINTIKQNNWIVPEEEKTEASGWIYYLDNDDHHVYRIDSNGENKQLISAHTANSVGIKYINGRVYFEAGGLLVSVMPDGSDERLTKLPKWYNGFLETRYGEYYFGSDDKLHTRPDFDSAMYVGGARIMTRMAYKNIHFHDDEAIYLESWDSDTHSMGIWRVTLSDDGFDMENITDGMHVTDYRTKDGKLYFIDREPSDEDEDGYAMYGKLYCAAGGKVTVICDKKVDYINFYNGEIAASIVDDDIYNPKEYLMGMDGSNLRIWDEWEKVYEKYSSIGIAEEEMYTYTHVYTDLSDENYLIYNIEHTDGDQMRTLYYSDKNGESHIVTSASSNDNSALPDKRIGNVLYYNTGSDTDTKRSGQLHAFNMDTQEDRIITDGVKDIKWGQNYDGIDWLTYTDYSGNIWRYNGVTDTLDEVFPCKGIKKRGALQAIAKIDGVYYKIDRDGNYSFLTDGNMDFYYEYVENGSKDGVSLYG